MSEWIDATVADVTKYQKAGGTPVATNPDYYGGDIPFVVIEDITKSSRFLEKTENTLSCKGLLNSAAWLIQEPHVLYSMYATVGKPIINKISCATNQAIIALKENELIEQEFLYYQLLSIRPSVHKFTAQTTQSNLNAGVVKRLPITYPKNKAAQRKIVKILGTIDQTIAHTEALIQKYQQIKAGLMHDLFTRGITSDGQLRPPREQAPELYQETAIGWIPKEWKVKTVEEVSRRVTDGSHQAITREIGVLAQVPFIFVSCIEDEVVHWEQAAFISKLIYDTISIGRSPHTGMILFTVVGSIGRVAVLQDDREVAFERNIACISANERVAPAFLAAWLSSAFTQRLAERLAVGNAQKLLSLARLKSLPVPVPDADEQRGIIKRLRITIKSVMSNENDLRKFRRMKQGLMHDLLTGKVPVTLSES
jgi:type I restriction enzyme, S subunit